jgi:putative hydrolase of the HAD superfamily
MKGMKAVLFDFDGTLVTLEIDFPLMRKRVNETIAAFGVPAHILTAPFSWERIEQAANWLAQFDLERAKELERRAKAIITGMEDEAAKIAEPSPDVQPTLQALKAKGFKLALVTRNSMKAVQTVLKRHPLPFDAIVTRDHIKMLKPNPEHLLFALRQLGVYDPCGNPKHLALRTPHFALVRWHCAFVGDHPADVQAALRAGLMPIGIARNDEMERALRNAGAFVVVRRISELVHWLAR